MTRLPMRAAAVAVLSVLAALVLAGCGSAEETTGAANPGATPSSELPSEASCAPDSTQVRDARELGTADLDGDGSTEPVRLTAAGGECGNLLVAEVGETLLTTPVAEGPPVTEAFAVALPGREGQLFVTRADHPRGGFQVRVYAAGDGAFDELTRDGGSAVVPFVALDVQERPTSVDCGDGRIMVTEAVAHEPAGVVPAWDVRRTSYAVDGARLGAPETWELEDNVPQGRLAKKHPELAKNTVFASCRT